MIYGNKGWIKKNKGSRDRTTGTTGHFQNANGANKFVNHWFQGHLSGDT